MIDALARIFSANPITPREIRVAGAFALLWFATDVPQFVDWAWSKWSPAPVTCNVSIPVYSLRSVP